MGNGTGGFDLAGLQDLLGVFMIVGFVFLGCTVAIAAAAVALAVLLPRRLKQIRKAIQGDPLKKPKASDAATETTKDNASTSDAKPWPRRVLPHDFAIAPIVPGIRLGHPEVPREEGMWSALPVLAPLAPVGGGRGGHVRDVRWGIRGRIPGEGLHIGYGLYFTTDRVIGVDLGSHWGGALAGTMEGFIHGKLTPSLSPEKSAQTIAMLEGMKDFDLVKGAILSIELRRQGLGLASMTLTTNMWPPITIKLRNRTAYDRLVQLTQVIGPELVRLK